MYPFMGQECTLQMTNRVEVLVLLCLEVRLFLSRHGDGGLFWFNIEIHKYLLLHPWNEIHKSLNFCGFCFLRMSIKMKCLLKKSPTGTADHRQGCKPLYKMVVIKRNPEGVTCYAKLVVCRPFGALFVALANGGCTPACIRV